MSRIKLILMILLTYLYGRVFLGFSVHNLAGAAFQSSKTVYNAAQGKRSSNVGTPAVPSNSLWLKLASTVVRGLQGCCMGSTFCHMCFKKSFRPPTGSGVPHLSLPTSWKNIEGDINYTSTGECAPPTRRQLLECFPFS